MREVRVRIRLYPLVSVQMKDDDGRTALWHALRLDTPDTLDCAAMLLLKVRYYTHTHTHTDRHTLAKVSLN